jgi:catechol 2,3-dioxygenase-like lactoylglutathione lyase family enzyme
MKAQPMIAVADVIAASAWYQRVLGLSSAHGGDEYEMLCSNGTLVLQLHAWDAHEHPHLGDPAVRPHGNGVILWFLDDDVVAAYERAVAAGALVLEALKVNPLAHHREFWLRDPDGYTVVVSGPHGDIGTSSSNR